MKGNDALKLNSKWWRMPPTLAITQREYEANVRGMNIVFGAVLGFVLAGASGLPEMDFAIVLLLSASTVVTILYLSMSDYKLFYGVTAVAAIAALPYALTEVFKVPPIQQLQPTLAVWALMVSIVELLPHEQPETEEIQEKTQ